MYYAEIFQIIYNNRFRVVQDIANCVANGPVSLPRVAKYIMDHMGLSMEKDLPAVAEKHIIRDFLLDNCLGNDLMKKFFMVLNPSGSDKHEGMYLAMNQSSEEEELVLRHRLEKVDGGKGLVWNHVTPNDFNEMYRLSKQYYVFASDTMAIVRRDNPSLAVVGDHIDLVLHHVDATTEDKEKWYEVVIHLGTCYNRVVRVVEMKARDYNLLVTQLARPLSKEALSKRFIQSFIQHPDGATAEAHPHLYTTQFTSGEKKGERFYGLAVEQSHTLVTNLYNPANIYTTWQNNRE